MIPDIDWTRLVAWGRFRYVNDQQRTELEALHQLATNYLSRQPWFERAEDVFLGVNEGDMIGVFLFAVRLRGGLAMEYVWVVVGGTPPLHISSDFARNQYQALNRYVKDVDKWAAAKELGDEPAAGTIPIQYSATREALGVLRRRLQILDEFILQPNARLL